MLWLWTILSGALAIAVAAWFAVRITNRHVIRLCSAIPCAQPYYPVLGNTLMFACSLENMMKNIQQAIDDSVRKGQRALCVWFGLYPLVAVTDPNDIKTILNNSLSRGKEVEESSREYSKYGLLTSPVDHWKVTRRHLNLSFHSSNLQQLMQTFNLTSRQLVADLSGRVDGAVFDLLPHVMSAAFITISNFLYGPKIIESVSTRELNDLIHATELVAGLLAVRATKPWFNNGIVFKLLYGKEINSIKTAFRRILHASNINLAKGELLRNKEGDGPDDGYGKAQYAFQTILDAMRELKNRVSALTDQHIMEEMISFFTTGTDTIGVTVSSCLLALARFPHIQDRVYKEVCSVLSENDEDITYQDLERLTYLDQVLKETLRFFTVVPFTARAPNRDIDLGGHTIPANKLTVICLSSVFYDPKYFPDPYKFDPDRFSTPNSSNDVFVPFSRGPRNCIGKQYAMMLMKVMVAHVIRNYRLSTNMDVHNLRKKFMITVSCMDGYNVFLTKRSG